MRYIGLNLPKTVYDKQLRDGSVCVINDDCIDYIVTEERISREKRDGGYVSSLKCLIDNGVVNSNDSVTIGISSCCDAEPTICELKTSFPFLDKILFVNHHLSHAYSVFYISPFSEALIIVMDAGGNILEGNDAEWWRTKREQHSYFLGNGDGISLIGRDFSMPYEAGVAEIYRAFTIHLGWKSSQHAGKTMSLSSYGRSGVYRDKPIFNIDINGHVTSVIKNDPSNPGLMMESLFNFYGLDIVKKRENHEIIEQKHMDLALWVQTEIENITIDKIKFLVKKHNIRNICLSGGVAYNCKLNGLLSRSFKDLSFFASPASGDQGQSLGNALYVKNECDGISTNYIKFNPYLGINYQINLDDITQIVNCYSGISLIECDSIIEHASNLLNEGHIICWFQGRSEYGQRALGNRSILADPRNIRNKYILNKIKGREFFMPFAPSVINELSSVYFEDNKFANYMTHAVMVHEEMRKFVPAIVHIDGSSRIHKVTQTNNKLYYDLISEFYNKSGIPMVVNTSFNGSGEPIVENIYDAIKSFDRLPIKYLVLGNFILQKNEDFCVYQIDNSDIFCINMNDYNFDISEKLVNHFPNSMIEKRNKFALFNIFVDWLKSGRKCTTIRYRKDKIEYITDNVLQLYSTPNFNARDYESNLVANVHITRYKIKKFNQLNICDANNDGFDSLEELQQTLFEIYGRIGDSEYVTIYHIYPIFIDS